MKKPVFPPIRFLYKKFNSVYALLIRFSFGLGLAGFLAIPSSGVIVSLHEGSVSPLDEGFVFSNTNSALVPTSSTIAGQGVWTIDDNSDASFSILGYTMNPSDEHDLNGQTYGWKMKARILLPESNDSVGSSIDVEYGSGSQRNSLRFGTDFVVADPIVEVNGDEDRTIEAGRDIFHDYVIEKPGESDTVNFLVDGQTVAAGLAQSNSSSNKFEWGSFSPSDSGVASYQTVMLEVFAPIETYRVEHYLLNGDAAEELGGQSNTAVDVAGTADLTGTADGAMLFNQDTSRIELENSNFVPDSAFSVSAWIRLDSVAPGGFRRIVSNWDGDIAGDDSGAIILETYTDETGEKTNLRFTAFDSSDTPISVMSEEPIELDRWNFITARVVSGHMHLFIDGRLVGKRHLGESAVPSNSFRWGIGCDGEGSASSEENFHGAIDDVSFFRAALSDSEIEELYKERRFVFVDANIEDGQQDVAATSQLILVFDEDVDSATATSNAFELRGSLSGPIAANIEAFGRSIGIYPLEPLPKGEAISLLVNDQLKSVSGTALQDYAMTFETEATDRERLYWSDTNNRSNSFAGFFVDTAMGAFLQEAPTLAVQSVRPMALSLRYDSTYDRRRGAFGYGWTHPFEARIDVLSEDTVQVYFDAVRSNRFVRVDDSNVFESEDQAAQFDNLRIAGEGGFSGGDNFVLRRKNGDRYVFGPHGRLLGFGNRVKQYQEVEYEDTFIKALIDPASEKRIEFNYDFQTGLVGSINDVDTENENAPYRHMLFEYDALGRLTTIHEAAILNEREIGADFSSKFIPDNDPTGLVHEMDTSDENLVGVVTLGKALVTHARHKDLIITLTSPSGTVVTLHNRQPGSGELSFEGLNLFDFIGESPEGTWEVKVVDSSTGEFGSLEEWNLQFSRPTNQQNFSYSPADQTAAGSSKIIASTDALGDRYFAIEYDALGRVIAQDDGVDTNLKSSFDYSEGPSGEITTVYTDRIGSQLTMSHDANLRLISAKGPDGAETTWTYDSLGFVSSTRDPLGREYAFTYGPFGYMQTVTDPIGSVLEFAHGQSGSVRSITDAQNRTSEFEYTGNGNLRRITDANDGETNKAYGSNGEMTQNLIEDGGGVEYTWSNGVMQGAKNMQDNSIKSDLSYDPAGRPLIMTDAVGFETRVEYLPNGDIIRKIDPLGGETLSFYDHRSRIVEEVNKKGESSFYEYDGNDNVVRAVDEIGREYQAFYDGEDRLIREIDFDGRETTYGYDASGRRISSTGPDGLSLSFVYDLAGNLIVTRDNEGTLIRRVIYNNLNLPTAIIDALGNTTQLLYDDLGRQVRIVNPAFKSMQFEYDDLDRLEKVTDPLGREFTKTYYSDDMVSRIQGPDSNYARFSYDTANRITSVGNFFSSPVSDSYDGRGLLTRDNLPSGNRLIMEYDELGRLIELGETDDSFPIVANRVVGYEYDANNNVVKVGELSEPGGEFTSSSSRTYDDLDRITSYRNAGGETIAYGYSAEGEMNRITYPDGKAVQYFYDDAGRLSRVVDWASRETDYTYNEDGYISEIGFPNGAMRAMTYDDKGRVLSRIDLDSGGETIVEYRYTHDGVGNLMVESLGHEVPPYQPNSVTMTYNNGNRLATFGGAPVTIDKSGNMTTGPLNGASVSYDYDVRGNMITAGEVDYHYDFEDRLVGWTDGSETTSFTINPVAGLSQILVKTEADASETRYVYGVGLLYEDTPDGLRVFHYDERGSVVALSGEAGTVVGEISYGPYGEVYRRVGQTDTLFKFNGLFGVVTDEQNLCYMRFRWYSPEIKRFISQDVHVGDIAALGSMNRYTFAGSNPIGRVDPTGEFWNVAVGAAVGALVSVSVELVGDVLDGGGIDRGWEAYAGAAIGGAITGGILGACPTCGIAAEVAGAAATNLFPVLIGKEEFSAGSLLTDVAIAGALGKIGGPSRGSGGLSKRINYGRSKASFTTMDSRVLNKIDRGPGGIPIPTFQKVLTPNSTKLTSSSGKSYARAYGEDVFTGTLQSSAGDVLKSLLGFAVDGSGSTANTASPQGNLDAMNRARGDIVEGQQGVHGEFHHWKLYTGSLRLAQEPIPEITSRQLTTF